MYKLSTICPSSSEWDEGVASVPGATAFHSAGWARALRDCYGHRPALLHIEDEPNGADLLVPLYEVRSPITGRRAHCVPFADQCPVLVLRDQCGLGDEVLSGALEDMARQQAWKYVELRDSNRRLAKGESGGQFVSHQIDLEGGAEQARSRFHSSARRAIRKAEKSGLSVYSADPGDPQAMRQFFALHASTRRRHGLPPQPLAFFDALQRHLVSTGKGEVVLVSKFDHRNSEPLAAAVFLKSGHSIIYKYAASDATSWEFRPNNLLLAYAIDHFGDRSEIRTMDLGRSDLEDVGLRRFKAGWGAEERPLGYQRLRSRDGRGTRPAGQPSERGRARTRVDGMHRHVFRALPLPLNRLVGSLIYPHLA